MDGCINRYSSFLDTDDSLLLSIYGIKQWVPYLERMSNELSDALNDGCSSPCLRVCVVGSSMSERNQEVLHSRRLSIFCGCFNCLSPALEESSSLPQTTQNFFQWNVPNGLSLIGRDHAESGTFTCAGEKWRLCAQLFQVHQRDELRSYVAVSVEWISPDQETTERLVYFKISLQSAGNTMVMIKHKCTHRFVNFPNSSFTILVPMDQILDPNLTRTRDSRFSVMFHVRESIRHQTKPPMKKIFATYGFGILSIFEVALRYLFHFGCIRKAVSTTKIQDRQREGAALLSAVKKVFGDMENPACDTVDLMIVFRAYGSQLKDLSKAFEFWEFFQYFTWRLGSYWKEPEDSPFHSLFVGSYVHSFQNLCTAHLRRFDVLQLDTMNVSSFSDALKNACTLEDGQPVKASVSPLSVQRSTQFSSFPPVLRLMLKRFKFDAFQRKDVKLLHYFGFPMQLKLDHSSFPFMAASTAHLNYELTAIVAHEGNSLKTGYYVLYLRQNEKLWWRLSDTISRMTQNQVMESCGRSACFLSYTQTGLWSRVMHHDAQ